MQTSICAHLGDNDRIECTRDHAEHSPEGYYVLRIGGISIFPSDAQLLTIRAAIDACIAARDPFDPRCPHGWDSVAEVPAPQ